MKEKVNLLGVKSEQREREEVERAREWREGEVGGANEEVMVLAIMLN